MSVQCNTPGRRLDVDLDLHNALEAKGTAKLKVEQLNVVVDCLDAGFVNIRSLGVGHRTYASGKMFRSAAAIVVTNLRRRAIEGKDGLEQFRI